MNLKPIIPGAAVATALAFNAATALAFDVLTPDMVPLNISGTVSYTTNGNGAMGDPLMTVTFNTASLIKLLNSSPTVTNTIHTVTGTNQIPAGSSFAWNPYLGASNFIITNKARHFSFALSGSGYDFASLSPGPILGSYSLKPATASGTEGDIMQFVFNFVDGNGNELICTGKVVLNWIYGPVKTNFQSASLSVSMSATTAAPSFFAGHEALTTSFSATGSGSWRQPAGIPPFFNY